MLDRPKMYAASPEALESMLSLLDEILCRYGAPCSTTREYNQYTDYLVDHGFAAASCCGRMRIDNPDVSDDEIWEGLTAVWKEYIEISHFCEDA